ncbi:hypothetical protein HPB50_014933 [Hyalomma asiaticum]|uniref:Uncharacterized protein n=1 Tax=Hyalomma asiaticum TaxID=266040 RepID=A0ACB7S971_HYAAI|nr:hypothetical protein HPB50_014933 [Hyalomma asiaticum]
MKQLRLKVDALEKDYATRLTAGDGAIPAFSDMSEKLKFAEHEIKRLNAKVVSLEQAGASAAATAPAAPADTLREVTDQLMSITSRCDEAENRMRRSNLLFFGLEDHANEDWAASEQKIIKFCFEKLQLTLTGTQFERVHRLGRHEEKCRPIIVKLTFFKDKEQILSQARNLKGTAFSVREDFSLATRQTRRKLIEFAKSQNKPFKLLVDKLRIENVSYGYDPITKSVVRSRR